MASRAPILWITPKWPFPPEDGARLATVTLLKGLARLGEKIELLALVDRGIPVDLQMALADGGVSAAHVLRTTPVPSFRLLRFFHFLGHLFQHWRTPLTCAKYSSSEIRGALAELVRGEQVQSKAFESTTPSSEKRRYSLIVYDGLHGAAHSLSQGMYQALPRKIPVVYRAHNCETQIWERKAQRVESSAVRAFFAFQAGCMRTFETSVLRKASMTLPVSEVDEIHLKSLLPRAHFSVIPIGYELPTTFPERDPSSNVLFVGRLDWPPNREGLEWFLEHVWPEVRYNREDLSLTVIGSGKSGYLKKYIGLEGTQFLGRVDDLAPHYERALVAIVPLFYGSGTRVKAIEAAARGCAILSTTLGVEGLGLDPERSYMRAETEDEWIKSLVTISKEKAEPVSREAFQEISARFNPVRCAELCQEALESVLRGFSE
ncbi:MAG: glycosyltransferase [Bdellovibrionales bacterium]|nr:glycosyltransferase [Bdellovibrionales bacterium]